MAATAALGLLAPVRLRALKTDTADISQTLPGSSLTVWTTYDLAPDDPGVISEE